MGRSYKQCTGCGKRALSIATRCPGCGRELDGPVMREPGRRLEPSRLLSPQVVTGMIALAAIIAVTALVRGSPAAERRSPRAPDSLESSEVALAATAGLGSGNAAPHAGGAGELLVARTWTHVRKARRVKAELEAVLLPGDTVVADSLRNGWYRVALEGEVLGYVHRSTLISPAGPKGSP